MEDESKVSIAKKFLIGLASALFIGIGGMDLTLTNVFPGLQGTVLVVILLASAVIFFIAGYKNAKSFYNFFTTPYSLSSTVKDKNQNFKK